ncbi:hypothetical protein AXF42_Ash003473 [Apostasia shenzhenica]|uniref:mTERF domain-containing protein 1, mitochondrial n=1 Tax=Apostasia shenzhenica TaxID=1088818 RepID=A0A2I0BG90_9ASPA|nr:hypothetical protein AXF42_Ash003473 [Apostasia shenzhenica]
MDEALHFRRPSFLRPQSSKPVCPLHRLPNTPSPLSKNALNRPPTLATKGLSVSTRAPVSLLDLPLKSSSLPQDRSFPFREKMLYLESFGIDLFPLVSDHPPIVSASLADLRSAIDFLVSLGFSSRDLRRMCGMCPEILTIGGPSAFSPVITFLLREAGVQGSDLRRVISRRPRLLVSDVAIRLRPTLYFLQMLGIKNTARHAHLLSCSVEDKLIPRLEFLQSVGFSSREARSMAKRFPQIFCYSIKENLQPKFRFCVGEMGREMRELKGFPQYFSFSLEKKIRPRHLACKENGVFLQLPALLKPSDEEFWQRLEVCVCSSPPLRRSPLWSEGLNDDYL